MRVSRRAVLSGAAASLAHSALLPTPARAVALLEDPQQRNHRAARDGYPGAFATEAEFVASAIPFDMEVVRTLGYASPGDGGGHSKRRIATPNPDKPWHNRSADGSWWEVVPDGPIDPIVLGAAANGIAADDAALLAAAEFSRTFGVRISLRVGRTYTATGDVALGKIRGICGSGTLKVSGSGASVTIGGSFGSGKTLTLNARRRATSLRIAKHRLSPKQWIWIRSGENAGEAGSAFNPQLGDTGKDTVRYCEFARIHSVAGGDAVTLNDAIHYGYPRKSSTVYPVDFCGDPVFDDFTFDGSGQVFLKIEWSYNPFVSNSVKFINPGVCCLVLEHCLGGKIQGSYKSAAGSSQKTRPAEFQAIKVRDGCYGIEISPGLVLNGEQGVDCTYAPSSKMNGVTRRIRVVNGTYIGVNQQAITSHEGTEEIHIARNRIKDGGDGVSVRGPNNRILDNVIQGRGSAPGSEAVRIGNAYANGNIVAGNDIAHFEYGVRILGKAPRLPRNDTIAGNRIRDCRIGILASRKSAGSLVDYGLRITDNEIVDSVVSGIEVEDNLNGTILSHNVVRQESAGDLTSPIRIGSGSYLEALNNRAINCGAGVRALSLSKAAKGRFERNASDGETAKSRKARPTVP